MSPPALLKSTRWACAIVADWAQRRPLLFALAVVPALLALVALVFRPCYPTNDDVFMTMIVAGRGLSPAPDEHLVFTNVLIGHALKWLYTHCGSWPWYGTYLLLVHIAAQVAILYCALVVDRESGDEAKIADRRQSLPRVVPLTGASVRGRLSLYALYFGLAELPLLNALQFTTTAFVATQAGLFLLVVAWRRASRQESNSPLLYVTATTLLCLGALVRLESFLLALLAAVPLAIVLLPDVSRRAFVPFAVVVGWTSTFVLGATIFDVRAYEQNPNWAGFRAYNQLRGKFHDECWTFYTPETSHVFAAAGWSENDYAAIENWFSDYPEVYSRENLERILAAYPWQQVHQRSIAWSKALKEISRNRAVLAILLVLPFATWLMGGSRGRLAMLGSLAMVVMLLTVITWIKKSPPERVYFPLFSYCLAVPLLFPTWHRGGRPRFDRAFVAGLTKARMSFQRLQPHLIRGLILLMVIGVGMGVHRQCRRSLKVREARQGFHDFLAKLEPQGRQLLVCWECAMPFELLSPWDDLRSWSQRPVLALVWPQRTPCQEAIKKQFGVTNLVRAICEREDVVLIAEPRYHAAIATFAQEHLGESVAFQPSHSGPGRLVAGHLTRPGAGEHLAERPGSTTAR